MHQESVESGHYIFPLYINDVIEVRMFDPVSQDLWPELATVFRERKVKMPLIFCDPKYQIDALYYLLCRKYQVPAPAGNVYNIPLTREIIKNIEPDILVSDLEHVEVLLQNLTKNNIEQTIRTIFLFSYKQNPEFFKRLQVTYPTYDFIFSIHPLL